MPPPDYIRHQLHKLMEAHSSSRNNLNATSTPTIPPPPPYYTNNFYPPRPTMADIMSDIVYTDEPAPLTITIDATINVTGNNNVLSIAYQPASKKEGEELEESDSTSLPKPSNSKPDSEPSKIPGKEDREAKAARIASIIVKALREADGLTDEQGRKRTVGVILKCGVKVEGCNNEVFYDESFNRLMPSSSADRVSSGATSRKRASSEPPSAPSPPPPKRTCRLL